MRTTPLIFCEHGCIKPTRVPAIPLWAKFITCDECGRPLYFTQEVKQ